jgi:hypothetical protein
VNDLGELIERADALAARLREVIAEAEGAVNESGGDPPMISWRVPEDRR